MIILKSERDIEAMRVSGALAAEILNLQIEGITKAVREGFTAESSVAAVTGQDAKLLKHTGRVSVQLQTPGEQDAAAAAAKPEPALNLARP